MLKRILIIILSFGFFFVNPVTAKSSEVTSRINLNDIFPKRYFLVDLSSGYFAPGGELNLGLTYYFYDFAFSGNLGVNIFLERGYATSFKFKRFFRLHKKINNIFIGTGYNLLLSNKEHYYSHSIPIEIGYDIFDKLKWKLTLSTGDMIMISASKLSFFFLNLTGFLDSEVERKIASLNRNNFFVLLTYSRKF